MPDDLHITGPLALECVRALVAGLSPEMRVEMLRGLLSPEERVAAWKEIVFSHGALSLDDAAALTPWTPSGFLRVANRENTPFIKGPHKSPRAYRTADVAATLKAMRIWPHGRPPEVLAQSAA